MAISKRNYIPGDYEEVSGESLGSLTSGEYTNFKLDGIFSFDVSNITLYQDGSLVPSTAYELTQDTTYTAKEADYSGETLYKMFRITDAAYAGIETTINCYNFGSAVDNELLYTLYVNGIVIPRTELSADATLTTSTTIYNDLYVFDGLSDDTDFVITDGGGDERNKFTVQNDDDTYKIIVSGDVDHWVYPGQTVEFYSKDDLLTWCTPSWETVWIDLTNTSAIDYEDQNIGGVSAGDKLEFIIYYPSGGNYRSCEMVLYDESVDAQSTQSGTSASNYSAVLAQPDEGTNGEFSSPIVGNIRRIRRWHNGK